MANLDAPSGAKPLRHNSGGTIRSKEYKIASGSSTNIFTGDFVKLLNTGYIDVAAAGNRLLGVLLVLNTQPQMVRQHFQNIGLQVPLL